MTPAELRDVATNLAVLRDEHRKKADEHLAWVDLLEGSIRYLNERAEKETPAEDICPTTSQPHQPGNACIYCYVGNLGAKP